MPRRITLTSLTLAAALALAPSVSVAQDGTAGAFLAARAAGTANDFVRAVPFLERLMDSEIANPQLRDSLTGSYLALGRQEEAARAAGILLDELPQSSTAALVLMAEAFSTRDYAAVLAHLDAGALTHPAVDGLARAWANLGQGSMAEVFEAFDEVAAQDGMEAFTFYCRALALAIVGDFEGAVEIIEGPETGVSAALNRRGVIAHAQILGQLERFDDALELLNRAFNGMQDERVEQMKSAYAEGRAVPFDLIADPAEGMAEVLAVMASAVRGGQGGFDALLYARAAEWINPQMPDVQLMLGQLFVELEQPELAETAFGVLPPDSGFDMAATLGRAQVLDNLGQLDEAIEVLEDLVARYPDAAGAHQALADFLRRAERHEESLGAYTRAIELLEAQGIEAEWPLWFSRAVAHERSGQWAEAEADFRRALVDAPDQPLVLNYLGYSLVERRENLDEALEMIERAVAGDPDSGYIVDSLAWALFRLGRYEEALPHMERAVELMPSDPILNDHLGDVYWTLGRYREARFQWRRALSFGPHDDLDMDRVRRKIEVGLYEVLEEEGEPLPHQVD
ncbi:tetratricopeptide repeat protein [Pararhodobacter sp. SW119]|uniref:tetratricopeptide repeat protein n=1 Tax=Pararhodobacter sp. SW119 TaxID=2780075 RepID=UPI001ADF4C0C|nr:tetratricopeptide repeat protein [Pararhodobacter sp. SW119]